jgi:flagellar protein FlgJ
MDINLNQSQNFDQARNALELTGLNDIREQSRSGDGTVKKEALTEAAQQFEAIFMKMLLSSMRKAQEVLESDSPLNSESTKFYRDMHDQQMAVELSSNGSLGLTDLIVRQLGGESGNFMPSSALRNDANLAAHSKSSHLTSLDKGSFVNGKPSADIFIDSTTQVPYKTTEKAKASVNISTPMITPQFSEPKDFVTALTKPAQKVQQQLGVPFEVVIAQAALETGWGKKIIKDNHGNSSNNLFNIKADSRWAGDKVTKDTLEFERGNMVKKSAPFRMYESLSESVNDYVNFLSTNDRYQDALDKPNNVEHFLQGLQQAGYATDPQYANKIMATLRTVTSLISK